MATINSRSKLVQNRGVVLGKAVIKLRLKAANPLKQDESSFEIKKRPFFERFLEGQNRGDLKATRRLGNVQSMKYPSDHEDGGGGGIPGGGTVGKGPGDVQTMKYPSDGEDGGEEIDIGKRPFKPGDAVTLKFPSDGEDGGEGNDLGKRPFRPGDAVTLKFPSDGEDGGGNAVD